MLLWQFGPTRMHLMLSGRSPSPCSALLLRLQAQKEAQEHEEHRPCCLGDGCVGVLCQVLAVCKHP